MRLDEAQARISREERARYSEWIGEGVHDYFRDYSASQRVKHTSRTRASIIHDLILHRVRRGFQELDGAKLVSRRGRHLLVARDTFVGSFKKLDLAKRPHSIPTRQATRLLANLPLFPDLAFATHLFLGYQLNDVETDYSAIYIICTDGPRIAWEWRIDEPVAPFQLLPDMPAAIPVRPAHAPRPRVKLKKEFADEGASDERTS